MKLVKVQSSFKENVYVYSFWNCLKALFTFIAVHSHFALDDIYEDKSKKSSKKPRTKSKNF